jgi:hypothetical protein
MTPKLLHPSHLLEKKRNRGASGIANGSGTVQAPDIEPK